MTPLPRRALEWVRTHPFRADVILACLVAAIGVAMHLGSAHFETDRELADPSVAGVLLSLATSLPLAWRRIAPVAVLVAVTLAQCGLEVLDTMGPGWAGVVIACYSFGAYHSGRRTAWIAAGFITAVTLFIVLGIAFGEAPFGALVSSLIIFPAAIIFGDSMRRRRERLVDLHERAERAERERALLAKQEVQDERTRIARELHDVVAHSLSVMVIQAQAARRQLHSDPEQATQALQAVETTGRGALDEMRRILGVLRSDGGAERTPAPSLALLPDLVSADLGLPVELRLDGDLSGIPSGVELSAYRVVQEALTNTRRHAGKVGTVLVAVTRENGTLQVEVTDDGRGATTLVSSARERGHGLAGMRERVAAAGGRVTAGPRQGGGWRVHAVFPVTPTPVP